MRATWRTLFLGVPFYQSEQRRTPYVIITRREQAITARDRHRLVLVVWYVKNIYRSQHRQLIFMSTTHDTVKAQHDNSSIIMTRLIYYCTLNTYPRYHTFRMVVFNKRSNERQIGTPNVNVIRQSVTRVLLFLRLTTVCITLHPRPYQTRLEILI